MSSAGYTTLSNGVERLLASGGTAPDLFDMIVGCRHHTTSLSPACEGQFLFNPEGLTLNMATIIAILINVLYDVVTYLILVSGITMGGSRYIFVCVYYVFRSSSIDKINLSKKVTIFISCVLVTCYR